MADGPITVTSIGLTLGAEYGIPTPGGSSYIPVAAETLPGVSATFQGLGRYNDVSRVPTVRGAYQVDFTMGETDPATAVVIVVLPPPPVLGSYGCAVISGYVLALQSDAITGVQSAQAASAAPFNPGEHVTLYYAFDCERPIDGTRHAICTINRTPAVWSTDPQAPWVPFYPGSVQLGGLDIVEDFPPFTGMVHRVQFAFR